MSQWPARICPRCSNLSQRADADQGWCNLCRAVTYGELFLMDHSTTVLDVPVTRQQLIRTLGGQERLVTVLVNPGGDGQAVCVVRLAPTPPPLRLGGQPVVGEVPVDAFEEWEQVRALRAVENAVLRARQAGARPEQVAAAVVIGTELSQRVDETAPPTATP